MVYPCPVNDPRPESSVLTGGFDRWRLGIALAVGTAVVAVFMQADAHAAHGIGAAVVLGLASCALVWAGGPADRARRIDADPEALVVQRWTRVRTSVPWAELAATDVVDHAEGGAALLLVPRDRDSFFTDHAELRDVAVPGGALVPLGARAGVAEDVRNLLAARGGTLA